ncbi:hypothetical protein HNY73_011525, partial [Argiope bruennichi]
PVVSLEDLVQGFVKNQNMGSLTNPLLHL